MGWREIVGGGDCINILNILFDIFPLFPAAASYETSGEGNVIMCCEAC